MNRIDRLRIWRDHRAQAEIALGALHLHDGTPHDWLEDLHWACPNGHVSGTLVYSDAHDKQCLRCGEAVVLIEPMTEEAFASIAKKLNEAK